MTNPTPQRPSRARLAALVRRLGGHRNPAPEPGRSGETPRGQRERRTRLALARQAVTRALRNANTADGSCAFARSLNAPTTPPTTAPEHPTTGSNPTTGATDADERT